jgi:hypothetical protein
MRVMAQRGRGSAAALTLVGSVESIPRQRAPAELTDEQAAVWNRVTASQPADHFKKDEDNLVQYCRHVIEARDIAGTIRMLNNKASIAEMSRAEGTSPLAVILSATKTLDNWLKMQERESRAIAALATKMRITQQATTNHRGNKIESKKPWDFWQRARRSRGSFLVASLCGSAECPPALVTGP